MHHFDPDLDDEVRQARERFIDQREKQLQTITVSSIETAVKFLFTTNAGGAVAVLAYLGAISSNPDQLDSLKYSLALFFLGVIFIGILRMSVVHVYSGIFKKFQVSTKSYFSQQREWEDFYSEIEQQVKPSKIPYILGYASFGCFLLGSITGTVGLLTKCV